MRRLGTSSDSDFLVVAITVFALFPFYYAVLTSFRSGTESPTFPTDLMFRTMRLYSSASLSVATS